MPEPAIDERSLRLLVLARELLDRGTVDLRSPGLFSPGLALSAFQDAIEFCLVAVAHHTGARPELKFDALWAEVNGKSQTGLMLPRHSSMVAVNKARVTFKHHGVLPDRKQVEEFHAETRLFLRETVQRYFNRDFDGLSALELIATGSIRSALLAAVEKLTANDVESALCYCCDALREIRTEVLPIYQTGIAVQFNTVPPETMREIQLQVGNVREQLVRVREITLGAYFGVNVVDLRIAESLLPVREGEQYRWPAGPPSRVSAANVRRVITLLTRYAINVDRVWSTGASENWDSWLDEEPQSSN